MKRETPASCVLFDANDELALQLLPLVRLSLRSKNTWIKDDFIQTCYSSCIKLFPELKLLFWQTQLSPKDDEEIDIRWRVDLAVLSLFCQTRSSLISHWIYKKLYLDIWYNTTLIQLYTTGIINNHWLITYILFWAFKLYPKTCSASPGPCWHAHPAGSPAGLPGFDGKSPGSPDAECRETCRSNLGAKGASAITERLVIYSKIQ